MKTSLKHQNKKFSHGLLAGLGALLVVAISANPALAWDHGWHGGHDGHGGHGGHYRGLSNIDRSHDPSSDIYTSPGFKITTPNQVSALPDGEGALLNDRMVSQINGDEFLFRDSADIAAVLIKQNDWHALQKVNG